MNLETMRQIVTSCMPYDTGFMFNNGVQMFETNHYMMAVYDLKAVPYILYNELGTIYTTKNQYFIREKTIGALNARLQEESKGVYRPITKYEDRVKREATKNAIKQGTMEVI